MPRQVLFLGGNGHTAARLDPARAVLAAAGKSFVLRDVEYPGFDDRPRAVTYDQFLDGVAQQISVSEPHLLYATGIGGFIALCLRAHGIAVKIPLLLQAPVLWGLERRWFPRIMRLGFAPLIQPLFRLAAFQRRFVRKHFLRPPSMEMQAAFFDGYQRCSAVADFFNWLTPALLRKLESDFSARPTGRDNIRVWWGGRDSVVNLAELDATPPLVRAGWPVCEFADWGHYPMIESPDEWIEALTHELATVEPVP